jgi:hypothetical protein
MDREGDVASAERNGAAAPAAVIPLADVDALVTSLLD